MSIGLSTSASGWAAILDAAGLREEIAVPLDFQAMPELDANSVYEHRNAASSLAFGLGRVDLDLVEEEGIFVVVGGGGGTPTAQSDDSMFGTVFGPIIDRTMESLGVELDSHLGPKIDAAIDAVMDMAFGEDGDGDGTEEGGGEEGGGEEGGGAEGEGGDSGGSETSRTRQPGGRPPRVLDALDDDRPPIESPSYGLGDTATHEVADVARLAPDLDDDVVQGPRAHRAALRRGSDRDLTALDESAEAMPTLVEGATPVAPRLTEPAVGDGWMSLPEVDDEVLVSVMDDGGPAAEEPEPPLDDDPLDELP